MRATNRSALFFASLLVAVVLIAPAFHATGQEAAATDPRLAEVVGYYTGTSELASEVIAQVRALAEQDSAEAAFLMGTAHAEALGVEADPDLSIHWYFRAAGLGNVLAQHNLGNAYRNGDGLLQDASMAAFWYRQSASQGDALTAFWLGQMYERGEGVAQSRDEALRWYRESADRGNSRAIEALAELEAR